MKALVRHTAASVRSAGRDVGASWDGFWHEPTSTAPLELVRVALGTIVALSAMTLLPDAASFLGPNAVIAPPDRQGLGFGLFQVLDSDAAAVTIVALLIGAGIAVALGWNTRVASVVVFVILLSIWRRNPFILNSGDTLLRNAVLLLALSPAGTAFSLDRRRRRPSPDSLGFPPKPPWALRLLQLQLTIAYAMSVFQKLRGAPWVDGTALASAWRVGDLARGSVPLFLYDSALLLNILTYATLLLEVALAFLIWNRRARPYVIALGLALHLSIEFTMRVGFFGITICALYLAFITPETAERWIRAVREWIARRRSKSDATPGETTSSEPAP